MVLCFFLGPTQIYNEVVDDLLVAPSGPADKKGQNLKVMMMTIIHDKRCEIARRFLQL